MCCSTSATATAQILVLSPKGGDRGHGSNKIGARGTEADPSVCSRRRHGLGHIPGGEEGDGIRIIATPINVLGTRYTVVVARDLSEQADRLESAAQAVFFGIPLALIVAAAGGYLLARKSFAPVTTMSLKARQIGAETLDERIEIGNERDELGFLAATLNGLLERLQLAFESQRRFMADASHELRTPIAIIQGEADVALARDRDADDYRESIEVMQRAARKLTRIVQNLFLLARGDAGRYPISMSRFYAGEVVADCIRGMRSVAQARGVALSCSAPEDIVLVADEELIHRLVLNLVENAVKFTQRGGKVHVDVRSVMGRARSAWPTRGRASRPPIRAVSSSDSSAATAPARRMPAAPASACRSRDGSRKSTAANCASNIPMQHGTVFVAVLPVDRRIP